MGDITQRSLIHASNKKSQCVLQDYLSGHIIKILSSAVVDVNETAMVESRLDFPTIFLYTAY